MNIHVDGRLRLQATRKSWAIHTPFHITGYTFRSEERRVGKEC